MALKEIFVVVILCVIQDSVRANVPINLACSGTSSYMWLNLVQPADRARRCQYMVRPYTAKVCQIRVDFTTSLAPPRQATTPEVASQAPTCEDAWLRIGRHTVCGSNSNQHFYIDLPSTGVIIDANPGTTGTGRWQIQVTQVICGAGVYNQMLAPPQPHLLLASTLTTNTVPQAPSGCDQFYTARTGDVYSINYNSGVGPYPAGLHYAMCFNTPASTSRFEIQSTTFHLNSNPGFPQINDGCYDMYEATPGFSSDYLFVPFSTIIGTGQSADYFCGDSLHSKQLQSSMFGRYSAVFKSGKYRSGTGTEPRAFAFSYRYI